MTSANYRGALLCNLCPRAADFYIPRQRVGILLTAYLEPVVSTSSFGRPPSTRTPDGPPSVFR